MEKRSRHNCKDSGFSILEVLIALSIFSVGVLAVAQMQIVAIKNNNTVSLRSDAMWVGQEQMEEVAAQKYSKLTDIAGITTEDFRGKTYDVTISLGTPSGNAGNMSRDVLVEIGYDDGGKTKTISFSTVRSEAEE